MRLFSICTCAIVLFSFGCGKSNEPDKDIPSEHKKSVGASAEDLLKDKKFEKLKVDLVYIEGYKPTAGTVTNLKNFLGKYLNKPDGIIVEQRSIASPGLAPYSIDDIRQVENDSRKLFNAGDDLAVFAFIADGNYSDNDNVLGVAYRNTSVALFGKKIDQVSGGIGQPSETLLASTVINHEFGHIMGLVNNGTPVQSDHHDAPHGAHCDVDNCLMYFAAETGDIVSNLVTTGQVPDLDSQCQADLKANGGK